jgi:hypothetical protein
MGFIFYLIFPCDGVSSPKYGCFNAFALALQIYAIFLLDNKSR